MPELPEVETIKRNLQRSLLGKTISGVLVLTHKMVFVGIGKISALKKGSAARSKKFANTLSSQKIKSFSRRGKFLIIQFHGGSWLLVHLRMSGQLIFIPKSRLAQPLLLSVAKSALPELLPTKHTHAVFSFSDGGKLFYNDVRQFGHLRLVTNEKEFSELMARQNLGPEPLEISAKDFFATLQANPKRAIKALLLDQSVIAGVGNIYADESLFAAKINPSRPAGKIKFAEAKNLLAALRRILKEAIKRGGSSLEYFLKTNGSAGSFSHEHQVYGKSGELCPCCGAKFESKTVAGRTSTYCPRCQKY
jgi:formamidopyrimidine-DNA glycosylase